MLGTIKGYKKWHKTKQDRSIMLISEIIIKVGKQTKHVVINHSILSFISLI